MEANQSIAIIGAGRLGGALALALAEKGHQIRFLVSRRREKAQKIAEIIEPRPRVLSAGELEKISADAIFITTPDPDIRAVAESLAQKLKRPATVFHTSGALSSEILRDLRSAGCPTGSLHPLVSVSEPVAGARRFKNVFFCLEGDAEARRLAEKIVADLEGKSFSIETSYKALYHAAAVMASGHLTALVSAALEILTACRVSEDEAPEILLPLVASAVENLKAQTPAQALTGTFARADVKTLESHLGSLRENVSEELLAIYRLLGLRSLGLAARQGADAEKLAEMKRLLTENF